ncbi:MAG TPA: hypothetical protein VMZ28_14750 [Kofleriaceae bacterium]|nr:hypothetical protein [Kofleriaceae bacterium]
MSSRRASGVLLAISLLCAAAPARAQRTSSLSWTRLPGAEACLGAAELARRGEERLGRAALVTPSQAELSVEGRVEPRSGGGWRATVAVARAGGELLSERVIETREPRCSALDDAVVLVIALLIDPEGAPAAAPAPSPQVIIREVVREVRVPVPVREPWHLDGLTAVEVEHGATPSLGALASLGLAVDPPGVPRAELAGFVGARDTADSALDGRAAELRLFGVTAALCPSLGAGRVALRLCGGVRAAWLRWRGAGFESDAGGTAFIPAVTAELRGELRLAGRLRAFAGAGARAPLRRAELTYTASPAVAGSPEGEVEELYRAAPVSVWVGAGLLLEIF